MVWDQVKYVMSLFGLISNCESRFKSGHSLKLLQRDSRQQRSETDGIPLKNETILKPTGCLLFLLAGQRKTCKVDVRVIAEGTGVVIINGKDLLDTLPNEIDR